MVLKLGRLYTTRELQETDAEARSRGLYSCDPSVFVPGTGWEMSWYYDPTSVSDEMRDRRDKGLAGVTTLLSVHYWRDWSHLRPPINVVCPNGEQWCVDGPSSNGTGWVVTGTWPLITASPSIVVPGYHGFLRDGEFTDDLEGWGPSGRVRLRTHLPRVPPE